MKKIIIGLLSIFPLISYGQLLEELPQNENGKLIFTEVVQADSQNSNQLYISSKKYFVDVFKSANDVIQLDDKESCLVIGKGFTETYSMMLGIAEPIYMWYTIKIQCKDGRYKYDIYDIYFESPNGYCLPDGYAKSQTAESIFNKDSYYKKPDKPLKKAESFKVQMLEKIENIKTTLKESMEKDTSSNNDNW